MYFTKLKHLEKNHKSKDVSHIREIYLKNQYLEFQRDADIKEILESETPFPETVPRMVNTDFETGCLGLEALSLRCP